jgi:hypothetical protein
MKILKFNKFNENLDLPPNDQIEYEINEPKTDIMLDRFERLNQIINVGKIDNILKPDIMPCDDLDLFVLNSDLKFIKTKECKDIRLGKFYEIEQEFAWRALSKLCVVIKTREDNVLIWGSTKLVYNTSFSPYTVGITIK